MKEVRTFWEYKYSVEMEPKVSLVVNESERTSDITWEFHIDLIEYPDGLNNDMVRWILNFIWEMEKSAIKESMNSALSKAAMKNPYSITDPDFNPYHPYGWVTLCSDWNNMWTSFTSKTKN